MLPEKKPSAYQRTLRLPNTPRAPRVGILIDTSPFPSPYPTEPQIALFGQAELGRRPIPYTTATKYWKEAYESSLSAGLTKEEAWAMYSGTHFGQTDRIDADIRRMKNGEFQDQEEFYQDPHFFRQKLLSGDLRAGESLSYGLVALRMGRLFPEKREEFDALGFSLLEDAERKSPRFPIFKLALWKEYQRKAEERPKKKRKEKKERIKIKKHTLINNMRIPGFGNEFSTAYYVEKINHWSNVLDEVAKGRQIDYQEFRDRHKSYVTAAKKEMDNRVGPDKKRKRYSPIFFEEYLTSEELDAFNAYYWGLVALCTPGAKESEKKQCEELGFKLLEKSHDLSVIEKKSAGKEPSAFLPWAIKEEYLAKMTRSGIQSKRQVRSREISSMLIRSKGEPEEMRVRRSLNETPSQDLDEIPR